MPSFSDGGDIVQVQIGGDSLRTVQSYDIDLAFFNQPAAFAFTLGDDTSAREFKAIFRPNQAFALRVNGRAVQSGRVDSVDFEGPPTRVKIAGRDYMQRLQDAFIEQERVFNGVTYAQLVHAGLDAVGLHQARLIYTNDSNRRAISGAKANPYAQPVNVAEDKIESTTGGKVHRRPQAKLGEKWADFLRRHLDRAGLFLWTSGDLDSVGNPTFILSRPNTSQKPIYRLVNNRFREGGTKRPGNVLHYGFRNDTKGRYSEVRIYTRGSSKSFRRGKTKGAYTDDEMLELGYARPKVIRDAECSTEKQAEFMARREIAESRRNGAALTYTVEGHSVTSLDGKSRLVWTPDTMVAVEDDELDIRGTYWVDTVHFSRSSGGTTTTLTLQDPADLVYGDPT